VRAPPDYRVYALDRLTLTHIPTPTKRVKSINSIKYPCQQHGRTHPLSIKTIGCVECRIQCVDLHRPQVQACIRAYRHFPAFTGQAQDAY
jgi:hypothetical protein